MSELPSGLRAFVDEDVALLPVGLSEGERAQLLAVLTDRGDVVRLDRLGASPDKALAKAARKALHVLRTRGAAPAPAVRVYRAAGPYVAEPTPSYSSIVDGRGERVVWYVEPTDGGYTVFEVELSETVGVLSLVALDVSRKSWRDQVAHMRRSNQAITGEIPGTHARVIIERAYRRMVADGRSPPEAFARAHVRIQASDEELDAPHPVRARIGTHEGGVPAEMEAILDRPELRLLVPPKDAVNALDVAIGEVVTSKLVLEPGRKLVQVEEAIVRVAEDALTPSLRTRLSERLLELALLITSRQPDDAGLRAAGACVEAADRLADEQFPVREQPTLLAMYRRLVPAELLLSLEDRP